MTDIKVKKEEKGGDELVKMRESYKQLNIDYQKLREDYESVMIEQEKDRSCERGIVEGYQKEIQELKIEIAVQRSRYEDQISIIEASKKELNEANIEIGKLMAKYDDLSLKYKGESREREKVPKEVSGRDDDSRAKSLSKEVVEEVVRILIEEGPSQFSKRIDYCFRNNKIQSDSKKADELVNNVFYQKENCTVYYNAVLEIVETQGDYDWETLSKAIDDADDELARREKNVQKIFFSVLENTVTTTLYYLYVGFIFLDTSLSFFLSFRGL
ncbi:hypothetical protein ACTFIZ_005662 [Dictyostelium cf. discoideum]